MWMIDRCRQGGSGKWADARHLHKTPTNFIVFGSRKDHLLVAFNVQLKVFDLID
ncbi:hypothetical protein ACNJYA_09200 [Bradyrhizobium sp. DASA03068]|uniref:hypothetical protein n=1 Tax=Bradyrhizobium sp. BLXBL-01 TaxID=3395915 RepID=UPI003F6EDD79